VQQTRFLVLGAGVTGLAFAQHLEQEDKLVCEALEDVGGYCRTIRQDGFVWDYSGHFFHFRHADLERELVARIGEAGRRLHTGRSRNEQVSLDFRLYLKRRIPEVQRALHALIAVFVEQAEQAGGAVMPSYTHLRRAQPVLVAHMFLSHAAAFRRDADRFDVAIQEADVMPLGSGAIAGTAYDIDTALLAERLGFTRVVANSIDASGDRDFVASFLYACSLAMVHLSRLAEDLILFSSEEF
jgi:argininosuccinate lyase